MAYPPGTLCTVDNCHEDAAKRDMCKLHYQRWCRTGSTDGDTNKFRGSTIDRFWYFVRKLDSGCWYWGGPTTEAGRNNGKKLPYGIIWVTEDRIYVRAHRWSYEHFVGPIPEGLQGDHLCDFSLCVNPEHIEPKINAENSARSKAAEVNRARQLAKKNCDHCGQPLTQISERQRGCRPCKLKRDRERQRNIKLAETNRINRERRT